ncbi:craniofacial development protein 2-like [Saccostrea cucullata]|uniref:craniofacial development protein 2-like n=1 Tax=Saccostrea cuccullata TaxID=36930 RepID=UPI002ED428D8
MGEVLNTTKTKLRLGHWNVRTMYETGKLAQITSEMRQFNLHVLGVSESRWTGSGKMRTTTGETVLYSGRDDNLHREGVAIIFRKGVERCLLEWKPINNRLISARLKGKHINTTLIQCYAPTNDSNDEDKDNFYSQLQAETEKTPRHDLLIIMGDLNAKVGKDNTDYERVMGNQGVGNRNDNGERLVEFCAMNNLVIGGTLFTHPDIHKLTWNSPNGRDKNQIDHLMINGMWRRSLLDVRVKRSADIGSDHHLVTALIKIKLKKANTQTRFDIQRLRENTVKVAFISELRNRFQILQDAYDEDEEANVDNTWKQVTQLYTESSKKKLGFRKRNTNKNWIQQETLIAIEERKKIKKKMLQTKSPRLRERQDELYGEVNKRVKKLARRDKREAMDQLAAEAEKAAVRGEQGRVYNITKRVCGKFIGNTGGPIKDKHGTLLTSEKDQKERWVEHFREVLNRPSPDEAVVVPEATEDLDIDTDPPTKEEIMNAVKTLKNGKSPGRDNLDAELFKADPGIAATILQPLFTAVWDGEKVPDDWCKGVIFKIPKKGALSDCNNWRGITLLSVPSKVLAKIIIKRMSDVVDAVLRKEQA